MKGTRVGSASSQVGSWAAPHTPCRQQDPRGGRGRGKGAHPQRAGDLVSAPAVAQRVCHRLLGCRLPNNVAVQHLHHLGQQEGGGGGGGHELWIVYSCCSMLSIPLFHNLSFVEGEVRVQCGLHDRARRGGEQCGPHGIDLSVHLLAPHAAPAHRRRCHLNHSGKEHLRGSNPPGAASAVQRSARSPPSWHAAPARARRQQQRGRAGRHRGTPPPAACTLAARRGSRAAVLLALP